MSFVDEGRMISLGRFDPWARCDRPSAVKRDGHDLEALRRRNRSQLLPHGQAEAAPSPRRPRDQQDLDAAQRRSRKGVPSTRGSSSSGTLADASAAATRLRSERPQPVLRVMHERARGPLREDTDIHTPVPAARGRSARRGRVPRVSSTSP